jgi:hypothetical protein
MMAVADAFAAESGPELLRQTGDVIRFLWNGNGTQPALRQLLMPFSRG